VLETELDELVSRHEAVAVDLPDGEMAMAMVRADAEALLGSLTAAVGRRLRPADLDHLVGHGELWSSRLVAARQWQARGSPPPGWTSDRSW
jgi:hypothetical protein